MPKISNLPAAASAIVTDLIAAVQGGVTKKETLQQVLNLFSGTITITEAQVTGLVADLASKFAIANNLSEGVPATMRTNLGLVIGTNVQAYNANLQSISALGTAANKMIYTTALNTWAEADISAVGRGIVNLGAGAAGVILRSNGTNYVASTSTFADTYAINSMLFASAANAITALAPALSSVLLSSAASTGVPVWSGAMTNGQMIIGSTGATPVVGTISAGAGISITPGAGTLNIAATGSGIGWSTIAGTTQAAAVDNGYVVGNAAQTTVTLPAVFAVGATVEVRGLGAGGWILQANAGDTIQVASAVTSAGGTVTSAAATDIIEVTGLVANTTWQMKVTNSTGLTVA